MMSRRRDGMLPQFTRQDGVVAVEFVILFPLFLMILVGLMEFGHLFYVRHTLTNASREGARAGAVFFPGLAADRISLAQAAASQTVQDYLFPSGQPPRLPGVTVTPPTTQILGSGASAAGEPGSTITVTLTATNAALVLGEIIDRFKNLSVSAQTTMKLE
jgi:Flp pilus assembly protein TadG